MVKRAAGAVLLEVILALALFVGAASAVAGGLAAAAGAVERLRLDVQAADLASSTLSRIQIGLLPAVTAGPESFAPPDNDWSWQVAASDIPEGGSEPPLRRLEVTVRNAGAGVTRRLVQFIYPPLVQPIVKEEEPGHESYARE